MKKQNFFLIAGAIWEFIRFLLFFLFITGFQFHELLWNRQTILWLILLSSAQLIMPAGFLLLIINFTRFRALIQLLRYGKILGLFSSLILFIDEMISGNVLLLVPIPSLSQTEGISFILLSLTIFFDLILLYFLLSFKEERPQPVKNKDTSGESSFLPVFSETEVKDEITETKAEDS
ncbi:MAG: hypothetical protein JW881_06655 [Spirochaetales bacterium]|nr:hypothetical protein [Spirochaetales bacterium]